MKLEAEVIQRSKNTPAITDYFQRCQERQRNENFQDYNFNFNNVLKSNQLFHFLLKLAKIFLLQQNSFLSSVSEVNLNYLITFNRI